MWLICIEPSILEHVRCRLGIATHQAKHEPVQITYVLFVKLVPSSSVAILQQLVEPSHGLRLFSSSFCVMPVVDQL